MPQPEEINNGELIRLLDKHIIENKLSDNEMYDFLLRNKVINRRTKTIRVFCNNIRVSSYVRIYASNGSSNIKFNFMANKDEFPHYMKELIQTA